MAMSATIPAYERKPYDNVVSMFWDAVDAAGDRQALIEGDRSLSYRDYGCAVAALAARLIEAGVSGERVAMCVPNSLEANVAIFSVLAAGAQVILFNPLYTSDELRPLMESAKPKIVIVQEGADAAALAVADLLGLDTILSFGDNGLSLAALIAENAPRPEVSVKPDAYATLQFTGGTTGKPKGVDRPHRTLMECVHGMHEAWPTQLGEEVWLNVAPVSHVWGFAMGCMNPVYAQSPLVIVPRFRPDLVLDALVSNRVTVFSGGPASIYVGLLAAPGFAEADLSALSLCPGGGSPFLKETLISWERAAGVPILEAYGMTEAGPITVNPKDGSHRYGTVGQPLPGVELEISSPDNPGVILPLGKAGEVRLRGSRVINHYRGEEAGNPEGWLYTGDIGFLDEDGYLTLVDRKKDMLIVNGFNVFPREIEEVLAKHPGVAEAAVIGVSDDRKGEIPIAFAVLRAGYVEQERELEDFCAERLVPYKRPTEIFRVDDIPKTKVNKTCRRTLGLIAKEKKLRVKS